MASVQYPTTEYEESLWLDNHIVAGVDEAGRGALAGPVVAAAVILRPGSTTLEGIRDSKLIPELERERLYESVCSNALSWGVGIVDHQCVDSVNVLEATFIAMNSSVSACGTQPTFLLIDGNRFKGSALPFRTIVDGDALVLSIAAASVIAKVTRDRLMRALDKEYPVYGFARHKGYGTKMHREAITVHGASAIHRQSFLRNILHQGLLQSVNSG